MFHRHERMRAVASLVHAVVAVAPRTLVTNVALPIAVVGKRFADVAEHARV